MIGKFFYNEGIRRLTIAFGQIFNNVMIQKTTSTGAVTSREKVPLAYASREKFLSRLEQQPDLEAEKFAIVLPRLSFEMTGLAYDNTRNLQKLNKFRQVKAQEDGKVLTYNYTPVPYNVNYTLHLFTANNESALQIIEQILPYFQPDYTVTINAIPDLNIKKDVPIVLNNISFQDNYEGAVSNRRTITYSLDFTAKTYLFGPITNSKVIKETKSDLYSDIDTTTKAREERIIVVPNPVSSDADDEYGFTTTIQFFDDAKKYNPSTDTDS